MPEVDLSNAYNEARQLYAKRMQLACRPETPSTYQESVISLHVRELAAACAAFKVKAKALGADLTDIDDNIKTLTEELNKREKEFFDINVAKTAKTVQKAIEAFYKAIERNTQGKPLCLNSLDVENVHREGVQAAEKTFDGDRTKGHGPDWDRHYLIDYLESKVTELRLLNTKNNKLIGFELATKYFQDMMDKCTRGPRLSDEEFNLEHEKARVRAHEGFAAKRNRPKQFAEDILKFKLEQYVIIQYSQLKQINSSASNKEVFQLSVTVYDQNALALSTLWKHCLHPDDLKKDHEEALCKALQTFRPRRACSEGFNDKDKDELDVHLIFENRYRALADINKIANELAEQTGFLEFRRKFNLLTNYYANRWNGITQSKRRECHDKAIIVGLDAFYGKRRDRKNHAVDGYKDNVLSRCKNYAQVL